MSVARKEVTTEIHVDICDICGEEITKEDKEEDPQSIGTIGHFKLPEPDPETGVAEEPDRSKEPTNLFDRVKFSWPSPFVRERLKAEAVENNELRATDSSRRYMSPYVDVKWYDFHGECLANLVKGAISLREKQERSAARATRATTRPTAKKKPS